MQQSEQPNPKGYTTTRALDNHRSRKKREKAEDAVYLGKKNRGVKRKDPPEENSASSTSAKLTAGSKYTGDMQAFKKMFWPQAGDWSKAGPVSERLKLARKALNIAVIGTPIPGPVEGLDDQLLPKIFRDFTRRNANIQKPTPVQAQVRDDRSLISYVYSDQRGVHNMVSTSRTIYLSCASSQKSGVCSCALCVVLTVAAMLRDLRFRRELH